MCRLSKIKEIFIFRENELTLRDEKIVKFDAKKIEIIRKKYFFLRRFIKKIFLHNFQEF